MISSAERRLLGLLGWIVAGLFAYLPLSSLPPTPPDLEQFYFAGQLVAAGQSGDLYSEEAYLPLERELVATGKPISRMHYYNRPAFGALPWAILVQLPYATVEKLVVFGNLLGILILTWKLPVWFPALRSFRPWLLCYPPFIWSVQFGQDTILITWALAYSIVLMRQGNERWAGVLLSLCLVKPHLIWLVPAAFFFCNKRTTAYWFAGSGLILAAISFLMVGTAGVAEWRELLGANTTDFAPDTMATLRAIGLQTNIALAIAPAIAIGVAFLRACRAGVIERALPIAIVASVLLSPHAYLQDASSFAVAASFSGSGLLIGAAILPWPVLTVLISHVAYPFAYVGLGLAIIGFFARRKPADALPRST